MFLADSKILQILNSSQSENAVTFDAGSSHQGGARPIMKLAGVLEEKKRVLLERWFRAVADTYPPETSRFLRSEKNRFANPVGFAVMGGLKGLLECLIAGAEGEAMKPHLDEIVRIRAVQNFSPAESVGCLLFLKEIVREELGERGRGDLQEELGRLDGRIDRLVLLSFDNYMACRETLFEIKVKELKDMIAVQTGNAWRRAVAGGRSAPNKEPTAEGQS